MSFVMFFDNGNTVQCTMWQLKKLPGTLTNHHFLVLKSVPAWPWWALISSPTPHCRIEYSFTFLYFLGHRNFRNKATLPLHTKQLRPFIVIRSNGQFIVAVIFKKRSVMCVCGKSRISLFIYSYCTHWHPSIVGFSLSLVKN